MIKEIKDFIKVFKETYKKYNKDKIYAKNCLDVFKTIIFSQKENTDKLCKLSESLVNCYDIVPHHVNIDYYRKTMNYLKFGNDVTYNDDGTYSVSGYYLGFIEFMKDLCKSMDVEYDIATRFYKNQNYTGCINRIKYAFDKFNSEWKKFDPEREEEFQVQED